jgi:D-alanyl-D-alanine carboxypeptidase
MPTLALAALIALAAGATAPAEPGDHARALPPFHGGVERLDGHVRDRIAGSSWRPGCPVPLRNLRLLELTHVGFDGDARRGRLVVHRSEASEVLDVMRRLYRERFPLRRVRLIDRFDADDQRSMAADNTSAFNCRFVAGTSRWSMHAYGLAIDINPIENPYVAGGHVSPPAGRPFADRSREAKGMVHDGDEVVRAFAAIGWEWGGDWSGGVRDYQHFSVNGR